jgi:hypothetical protein
MEVGLSQERRRRSLTGGALDEDWRMLMKNLIGKDTDEEIRRIGRGHAVAVKRSDQANIFLF